VNKQNVHFESNPYATASIARSDPDQIADQCTSFATDVSTIVAVRLTRDRQKYFYD
jgi:hypothetical protein